MPKVAVLDDFLGGLCLEANLFEIIACPICKGELVYHSQNQEFICKLDRLGFPVKDGLPVLFEDQARSLPADEDVD